MSGFANTNSGSALEAPARVVFNKDQLDKLSKEDLVKHFLKQEAYVEHLLETKKKKTEVPAAPRESEERMRAQQLEASRRENVLVMRLTTKEQEVQDYISQVEELRTGVSGYRSVLLDPAVNLMFQRFKQEIQSMKEKLEQSQQELNAWKFTPDSNTGKRLMAKCRQLLTENEELGKVISSGRVAKIEGELALSRTFTDELKKSQAEVDDLMSEMDEEMEGLQAAAIFLQSELKGLKIENDQLKAALLTAAESKTKVESSAELLFRPEETTGDEGRTLPPSSQFSSPERQRRAEVKLVAKTEEMEWSAVNNHSNAEEISSLCHGASRTGEQQPSSFEDENFESFESADLSSNHKRIGGRNNMRNPRKKQKFPSSNTPNNRTPPHLNGSIDRTTKLEAVSSDGEISPPPKHLSAEEDSSYQSAYRTSRPNGDDHSVVEDEQIFEAVDSPVAEKPILSPDDQNSIDLLNGVDDDSDGDGV